MNEPMKDLFESIAQQIGIPAVVIQQSQIFVALAPIKKGDCWVQVGDTLNHVGFVVSGFFRKFRMDDEGREFTTDLISHNDFIAAYSDLLQNRSATLSIQALEDSTIAVFDFPRIRSLAAADFQWAKVLLRMTEQLYVEKEWRESFFVTQSAAKRLSHFVEKHPELIRKVPKNIVASFLGINASTLSRQLKSKTLRSRLTTRP